MRLYLNESPRTFVVADSSYALVIRHPDPEYKELSHRHVHHIHHDRPKHSDSNQAGNKVLVEFLRTDALRLSKFRDITPHKARSSKLLHGFLGLLNVKGFIHLGFVTKATKVASPQLNESIHMIDDVAFYCLNSDRFDAWIGTNDEDLQAVSTEEPEGSLSGYPAASVRRMLSLGHFYFSKEFDVSCTLQERGYVGAPRHTASSDDPYFRRFAWNRYMVDELVEMRTALNPFERMKFDSTGFLTVVTRGYAKSVNVALEDNESALLTLVSKQSCKKSGALFGELGCDDEGEVPNFVESEVIIYSEKYSFSYVVIRGNVPSFWELEKNSLMLSRNNKRIKLTRSFEASSHAFLRHFDNLSKHFGDVHVINCLLQDRSSYKGELGENYRKHFDEYVQYKESLLLDREELAEEHKVAIHNAKVSFTSMPLSLSYVRKIGYSAVNPKDVVNPITESIVDFGALFFDVKRRTYVGKQLGVFRVNSFDCLTKANFVSKIISQEVINLAFRDMGISVPVDLLQQHAQLWSENDEVLKSITHAYMSSRSKVKSLSTKRMIKEQLTKKYFNVMRDPKASELAMLKLLGRLQDQKGVVLYNPFHQYVNLKLKERAQEFTSRQKIKIFTATFNVNGTVYSDEDLKELIYPSRHGVDQNYDLVFIGFQEIVELTPGKMISVKSDNFNNWEHILKRILNEHNPSREKYASLWGWQMGGIAMFLFIKESQLGYISSIEGSIKKTGLGGMSANKGGIAVSFDYSTSLICLICSHLAAGHSNVEERHQNYKTISKGIVFFKHKKVRDHDFVIWLGDFNFRIDLPIDEVKHLINVRDFQKLFEYDQLNKQMADGESFPFFDEKEITFPPTYKFDNNTREYDTSEKQRVPAWTDRILSLSRNKMLEQEVYDCEENIVFSDHRPVFSIFTASVEVVDERAKKDISQEIYESYTEVVGDINFLLTAGDVTKYVTDVWEKAIPPPSSDESKWWLKPGKSAKVSIKELETNGSEPGSDLIFNPQAPINPFEETSAPMFIKRESLWEIVRASEQPAS
ncbi:DNase I-like protein [Metschnikowia bicuspidata var. bicuspidata NRRL YB-4993]|uniref:phosphoinositide 5-phosphatase n=1 Tax=Metschnikowia bicuspidata var. bicuspidata NRRL YB-4993 TaxID=869754 RepID=A0A1A0H641_9ASCO|nr:DNase I-like protein [Metschnikowia bicuspidata var. bicuspidata NRRL YB-4993]OBA19554.1 DNase I-like protein [Metschnikowia bicuspidata var. bicuspidata NRRL YB-4993]